MILGIDPGLNGALALYGPLTGWVDTWAMPTRYIKNRKTIDLTALNLWIFSKLVVIDHAVLEMPAGMGGKFAGPAYTFGAQCGMLVALFVAWQIPYTEVVPSAWKVAMQLTGEKASSRRRADQLFPRNKGQWLVKSHEGKAEAALLAYYGYHIRGLR